MEKENLPEEGAENKQEDLVDSPQTDLDPAEDQANQENPSEANSVPENAPEQTEDDVADDTEQNEQEEDRKESEEEKPSAYSERELSRIVESLLFVSARPLNQNTILRALPDADSVMLKHVLGKLLMTWSDRDRGFQLTMVGNGYQFRSHPESAPHIREMYKVRPARLSRPALETLAIVAYRQPVTRAEIEDIRGVDCGGVLKLLLDRRLLRILGKREEPGRPLIYGTSREFLETFNLRTLKDLPTLREYEDLNEENRARVDATYSREETPTEEPLSPPDTMADDSRAFKALAQAADDLDLAVVEAGQKLDEVLGRTPYDEMDDGEEGQVQAAVEVIAGPDTENEPQTRQNNQEDSDKDNA